MGQQYSQLIPIVKNKNPIFFNPEIHEFQSQNVQRIKETPFVGAVLYNSQPTIYIEPAEITMQTLIKPRLNTMKLFPKQQIFKIIDNVLNGLNELKNKNFESYDNLSLSSIYYSQQLKCFKILNPGVFESSNYLMARQGLKFSFLAPQQIFTLKDAEQSKEKSFKTDIFVFGICLLQICTLRDSAAIYLPDAYSIFDQQIRSRLQNVERIYTKDLARFLELCLNYEKQKRLDLESAIKQIKLMKLRDQQQETKFPQQLIVVQSVLSPRGEPKKGFLPFGPGHLPKKLQSGNIKKKLFFKQWKIEYKE